MGRLRFDSAATIAPTEFRIKVGAYDLLGVKFDPLAAQGIGSLREGFAAATPFPGSRAVARLGA